MITKENMESFERFCEKFDLKVSNLIDLKAIGLHINRELAKAPADHVPDWERMGKWVAHHYGCDLDISLLKEITIKFSLTRKEGAES